jgi:hypothetical protein
MDALWSGMSVHRRGAITHMTSVNVTFPQVIAFSTIDLFFIDPDPIPRSYKEWVMPPKNANRLFVGRLAPYSGTTADATPTLASFSLTPFLTNSGFHVKLGPTSSLGDIAKQFFYQIAAGASLAPPILQLIDEYGDVIREIQLT